MPTPSIWTWSPWHYTGQNYGIAVMYLGRRGVTLAAPVKRLLYGSFVLSYVITFVFIHGPATDRGGGYLPGEIHYVSLGIPVLVADFGLFLAALCYVLTSGAALFLLRRASSLRALFPTLGLMGMQALWFVLPALVRNWSNSKLMPLSTTHAEYVFIWIALGHAVQYLWITSYFAMASQRARCQLGFFARALAAGVGIWTIPSLLFAPGALGRLPFDAGLSAMVAAVVNLHHFILDGAIWKLRDGRIARILLRASESPAAREPGAGAPRRLRIWPVLTAAGAERLAWIGRDSTQRRENIGLRALQRGNVAFARQQFERSIAFYPTSLGWSHLGESLAAQGSLPRAAEAYATALRLDPDNVEAQFLSGLAALDLGQPDRAREFLALGEGGPFT